MIPVGLSGKGPTLSRPGSFGTAAVTLGARRWFCSPPTSPLADPWRRFLASSTDVALLFLAHIIVVGIAVANDDWTPEWQNRALCLSPIFCWAYVWMGWSIGATPGKWLWDIRIIQSDGSRMNASVGARRCLGYILASIPAKAGLLPILYHPLRQGWHDRLARTLVVRHPAVGSPPVTPVPEPAPRCDPLIPDFGAPLRGAPVVFILYLLLALVMTYPVAAHFTTSRAGDAGLFRGDGAIFVWNYWYFSYAIQSGLPLLHTHLVFYPHGVPLLFHTMDWVNCALALPLFQVMNPVAAYNTLFILSIAGCAFAEYYLVCSLTRSRAASFVASLAFGFSPYFMMHGRGHGDLLSAEFLPVFILFYYSCILNGKARHAVFAGIFLALCALCDYAYLVAGFMAAVCLWIGVEIVFPRSPMETRRRLALTAGVLLLCGLLLAPLLAPTLMEAAHGAYAERYQQSARFSADLWDYIRLNPLHPLATPHEPDLSFLPPTEDALTVSLVLLGLAGVGLWRGKKLLYPWLLCAVVAIVVACGPVLKFRDSGPPAYMGLLVGGVPGNGWDPAWDMRQTFDLALLVSGRPQSLLGPNLDMTLPYDWLPKVIPVLKPFRAPARFSVILLLCVGVLASMGLSAVYRGACRRWGRGCARALMSIVTAGVLFEYLSYPYLVAPSAVDPFYEQMARDTDRYAVLDAPFGVDPLTQYYQTVHHKPVMGGLVSRIPPESLDFAFHNSLVGLFSTHPEPMRHSANVHLSWRNSDLQQGLSELRGIHVRYIIFHKKWSDKEDLSFVTEKLTLHLSVPVVWDDPELRVFDLRSPQPAYR